MNWSDSSESFSSESSDLDDDLYKFDISPIKMVTQKDNRRSRSRERSIAGNTLVKSKSLASGLDSKMRGLNLTTTSTCMTEKSCMTERSFRNSDIRPQVKLVRKSSSGSRIEKVLATAKRKSRRGSMLILERVKGVAEHQRSRDTTQ
jgi:hypothetical protein